MKRKVFIVFMIIFTLFITGSLFACLICGAPVNGGDGFGRYVFGAVGISVLLPAGFSFFFISLLDLNKKLEEWKKEEKTETEDEKRTDVSSLDVQISILVNALAKKKNLSQEEKEELLSYLEDL